MRPLRLSPFIGVPVRVRKGEYADYFKPLVLFSLYTGLRRGNALNLKWGDVDLKGRRITLRGEVTKGRENLVLPINQTAHGVLEAWKAQHSPEQLAHNPLV